MVSELTVNGSGSPSRKTSEIELKEYHDRQVRDAGGVLSCCSSLTMLRLVCLSKLSSRRGGNKRPSDDSNLTNSPSGTGGAQQSNKNIKYSFIKSQNGTQK